MEMSENSANNKDIRNDEIDLLDLFRRIGKTLSRWFNALIRVFLISVVFLVRRWLPLSLSVIAGIAFSYFSRSTNESFYTSDLVLRTNIEYADEIIGYMNRLHTYCAQGNKIALAGAISLKPDQVKNIGDISAYWVIDNGHDNIPDFVDYTNSHSVYDTTNVRMKDRLSVRVRINSPQELSNVRNGIINYINSDLLFQQRNELRLRQNNELLARLQYDILQLDSLQQLKYFEETKNLESKTNSQMVFLQEQKTQLVYPDIYKLYEKKQKMEQDQLIYKDIVTVLSDFTIPAERDNGGRYYAKKYIPIFFGITLLLLIILANRKSLKEIYNKY
jgi:hypothetical protein